MSNISEAQQERKRKALQREILRAQSNAQVQAKVVRKRDWGSIILVVIILLLILLAAFLAWSIISGRVQMPGVNGQAPARQLAGANPGMDNAWQESANSTAIRLDPNYIEDTVFIGDSNTVRLWMLELVSEEQCLAQDSIGIGAVTAVPLTNANSSAYQAYGHTILESIGMLQPKRVLLTFGSNDIGGLSVDNYINTYRDTVKAIKDVSDCEIIVNSIFPANRINDYPNLNKDVIQQFNEALEHMCKQEGIPFLDSYSALADEDGWCNPDYTVGDGVHLNEEGLQVFLDCYKSHAYAANE